MKRLLLCFIVFTQSSAFAMDWEKYIVKGPAKIAPQDEKEIKVMGFRSKIADLEDGIEERSRHGFMNEEAAKQNIIDRALIKSLEEEISVLTGKPIHHATQQELDECTKELDLITSTVDPEFVMKFLNKYEICEMPKEE